MNSSFGGVDTKSEAGPLKKGKLPPKKEINNSTQGQMGTTAISTDPETTATTTDGLSLSQPNSGETLGPGAVRVPGFDSSNREPVLLSKSNNDGRYNNISTTSLENYDESSAKFANNNDSKRSQSSSQYYNNSNLQTATPVIDEEQNIIVDSKEQERIRKQAQLDIEAKIIAQSVVAQSKKDNDNQQQNQKSCCQQYKYIIISIVLFIIIGIVAAIVVTVTQNNNNNNENTNYLQMPTMIPTISPTFRPTTKPPIFRGTPNPTTTDEYNNTMEKPDDLSIIPLYNAFCEDAFGIAPGSSIFGTTENATITNYIDTCEGINQNGIGVWYQMKGNGTTMVASTCDKTFFDTQISIYSGSCNQLICVAGNDQFCNDQSKVAWFAAKDEFYYILVHGIRSSKGLFELSLQTLENNDKCESAVEIEDAYVDVFGSTRGATSDDDIRDGCGDHSAPGVWYTFEVFDFDSDLFFVQGIYTFPEITQSTFRGSEITFWVGDDCDNLTCLGDANRLSTEPGNRYYLLVSGRAQTTGDFILNFEGRSPGFEFAPPPNVCRSAIFLESDTTTEAFLAAPSNFESCGDSVFSRANGYWFFTFGEGSPLRVHTCGSHIDTQISVFGGDCDNLQCIDGNDQSDYCGGDQSAVSWFAKPLEPYFIFVHGFEVSRDLFKPFQITLESINVTSVDSCDEAEIIPSDGSSILGTISTNNSNNNNTANHQASLCGWNQNNNNDNQNHYGSWFQVIGSGNKMFASTCHDSTTAISTQIAIYGGEGCDSLQCLDDNDGIIHLPCGLHSSVIWKSNQGQIYYIFVHGHMNDNIDDDGDNAVVDTDDNISLFDDSQNFVLYVEDAVINDRCENSIGPKIVDGSVTFGSTRSASFDNISCVLSPPLPSQSSPSSWLSTTSNTMNRGVWYSVIGNGQKLILSTCSIHSNFATRIDVFVGTNNDNDDFVCVKDDLVCVDDLTKEMDVTKWKKRCETVQWQSEVDMVYEILISGVENDDYGNFAFQLGVENEICVGAILLTPPSPSSLLPEVISITDSTSNILSTNGNEGIPNCGTTYYGPGRWYKVVGTGLTMIVDTCVAGTTSEARLAIFTSDSDGGGGCDSLVCFDSGEPNAKCGTLKFDSKIGEIYYIFVYGFSTGDYELTLQQNSLRSL